MNPSAATSKDALDGSCARCRASRATCGPRLWPGIDAERTSAWPRASRRRPRWLRASGGRGGGAGARRSVLTGHRSPARPRSAECATWRRAPTGIPAAGRRRPQVDAGGIRSAVTCSTRNTLRRAASWPARCRPASRAMPPSAAAEARGEPRPNCTVRRSEINAALAQQPGDPLLEELLLNTYQDELAVLAEREPVDQQPGQRRRDESGREEDASYEDAVDRRPNCFAAPARSRCSARCPASRRPARRSTSARRAESDRHGRDLEHRRHRGRDGLGPQRSRDHRRTR